MAYAIDGTIGVDLAENGSASGVNNFGLGKIVRADTGDFIRVQMGEAASTGDAVAVNSSGSGALLTHAIASAGQCRVGWCQDVIQASGFGWVQLNGSLKIKVANACQAGQPLFTTDTAGVLDDATASLTAWNIMGADIAASASASAGGVPVAGYQMGYAIVLRPRTL